MKPLGFHTYEMSTMLQIRNVPEVLPRRLKARAAMEGVSMLAAIQRQPQVVLDQAPADILRQERASRSWSWIRGSRAAIEHSSGKPARHPAGR